MTTQTVTLKLPEPLYRSARQIAKATEQPLEAILTDSIARTLPPLDDVSQEEASELARLASLDDASLWREARATMNPVEQAMMHELLDRQGANGLTPAEHARLQDLLDVYGQLMVRKAHAYLLLARRGYRVPRQEDLKSPPFQPTPSVACAPPSRARPHGHEVPVLRNSAR